jgi:DNA-binding transcriptional LysR family regulator
LDKLTSIKLFLQVVRAGAFARAAEQANLSPTSASRMVRDLEASVGTRLLNRSTRSLSLTDAGEKLFGFYSQVVEELEAAEAEAVEATGSAAAPGRLRVALPNTFATKRLQNAICRFRAQHPLVELEVRLDDAPTDLVREGFDLSIRIAPALGPSTIARRIASVPIVVCGSPLYLDQRGLPRTPADLAGHDCLLYLGNEAPDEWAFQRDGKRVVQRVRGSVQTNNGELLRTLAVGGQGIVLQPGFIVGDDIAAGNLVRVLDGYEPLERSLFAIYPSGRFIPAKVRAFTQLIATELASQAGR